VDDKACILLVESNLEVVSAVRAQLERTDYRVEVAYSADAAENRIRSTLPDAALVGVSGLDGESLCARLKEIDPSFAVGLISPLDDDSLDWRAESAGADGCIAGVLSGANLDSFVRGLVRTTALRRRLAAYEANREVEVEIEIPDHKQRPASLKEAAPIQGASAGGFDFFRRLLLVEVQRSKRYKYPLAFLLAAVDGYAQRAATMPLKEQASFRGKILRTAVKSVRDVDLCALYGTDRFVIFMPHTAPAGAKLVAGRLRGRIEKIEGDLVEVGVSIGLACYDGQGAISYGALLREASLALKKAQADGGNRVETSYKPKARGRVSMG
jgi:diguanylate cyclase (GGDEF)-like protein